MLKYTIPTGRYILKFENMALHVWLIFVQFSNAPTCYAMYWLLLANKNTKKWSAILYSYWI